MSSHKSPTNDATNVTRPFLQLHSLQVRHSVGSSVHPQLSCPQQSLFSTNVFASISSRVVCSRGILGTTITRGSFPGGDPVLGDWSCTTKIQLPSQSTSNPGPVWSTSCWRKAKGLTMPKCATPLDTLQFYMASTRSPS